MKPTKKKIKLNNAIRREVVCEILEFFTLMNKVADKPINPVEMVKPFETYLIFKFAEELKK